VPEVELERITKKPKFWNFEWRFDDFYNPNWLSLLAKSHEKLDGKLYFPPAVMEHCANKPFKPEILSIANERENIYIANLKRTHNK